LFKIKISPAHNLFRIMLLLFI